VGSLAALSARRSLFHINEVWLAEKEDKRNGFMTAAPRVIVIHGLSAPKGIGAQDAASEPNRGALLVHYRLQMTPCGANESNLNH
jgi:hypothetical protein